MKRFLIWFLATALVATPVAPALFVYLYFTLSDAYCPDIFVGLFWDPASVAVLFSVAAAVVLSYATFVVASPRPRGAWWRYALGVPVAVTAGIAVLLIAVASMNVLPLRSFGTPSGILCD